VSTATVTPRGGRLEAWLYILQRLSALVMAPLVVLPLPCSQLPLQHRLGHFPFETGNRGGGIE